MQDTELNLKELLFCALRQWRKIIIWAIVVAVLLGSLIAVSRAFMLNDEDAIEKWQTEYEVAYGTYWAAIYDLERQISANERLANQAQISIDKLAIDKTAYEGNIEDWEAKIVYYEALIEDYKKSIEDLYVEKEKLLYYLDYRKDQNQNSFYMNLDPYDLKVYEVYLRVDSGYEILPGSSVQNVDPTPEILQTYRLLANSTNFYTQMIKNLNLNTEVRYISEIVDVSDYSTNSLRVRVISDSEDWAKMVAEYIADSILSEHERVSQTIKPHDITRYNTVNYSVVDVDVYVKQQSFIQKEMDYEASIRDVDKSILNIEASIRNMNTDIRQFRQSINDTKLIIEELPIKEQAYEDKITGYRDASYTLKAEMLTLLEEPEPEYRGYTIVSVFIGFFVFAIIGGAVTAILMALYYAIMGILKDKVLAADRLCASTESEFFGFWPKKAKKSFAFVDKWIDCMYGSTTKEMTAEVATDLVLSNVAIACADSKKILLCGGASKETVDALANAVKARMPEIEVLTGGTIGFDPAVVRGMAECDAIILVEQLDKSDVKSAVQLKDRAQTMGKSVLGVILN